MDTLLDHCAGLDVHKDSVVTCVRHAGGGGEVVRSFGTSTRQLLSLGDFLAAQGVRAVAMEATGVYWKPVWNLLEDRFAVMLVNAAHVKKVPGRKTDVTDAQWIAQLLAHGLLSASFVPDRPQRELRELTRQRTQLVADRARVINRVQKVLEDANVKLASVASDVMGKSGRAMLAALVAGGSSPERVADLAVGHLRKKLPQLREALTGHVTDHHRFMLRALLGQVDALDALVESFDARVEEVMSPLAREAVTALDAVPGLDRRAAQIVVAEVGTDMGRFPSASHLASWAGLCPGNHESAGKRKHGRTRQANRWLKQALVQAAYGASRKRDSYFKSQYHRIAARRGGKRAAVAVAHSILVTAYHVLRDGTPYQDLGAGHFDRLDPQRQARALQRRLERLGYQVHLEPLDPAA